jgi:integrase
MGLGSFPDVPLVDARERARLARLRLSEGIDPIEERNARRTEQRRATAAATTFRDAARAVIASREAGWDRRHHREWTSTLEKYAFPTLGSLPTNQIDTALVLKCVEPVWRRAPVTGDRLRQRIETILAWATAHGYRTGDNPARWRGHIQHLLNGDVTVKHRPALPYPELPAFMKALREREGMPARSLEFTILTACRTGEVLGARWDEIVDSVWTIPAARMKARKPHSVPLSPAAMRLLDALPHGGTFIFPGRRTGQALERHAMRDLLKTINEGITTHGFRSCFMDWATECTDFEREVREQALAHSIPGAVERAYRRGALLEKRRKLMSNWSDYCSRPTPTGAAVVSMRKAAPC